MVSLYSAPIQHDDSFDWQFPSFEVGGASMQLAALAAQTNAFQTLVDHVLASHPLQRKALSPYLAQQDELFRGRAANFFGRLEGYLVSAGLGLTFAADAYQRLCDEVMAETVRFRRTGCYSCRRQADAFRDVYAVEADMRAYMVGLAVSQFLWRNHYAIYAFFQDVLRSRQNAVRYLEVGPGHGMYLAAAIGGLPRAAFRAVDISPLSIRLCREFLPFLVDRKDYCLELHQTDVISMPADASFDLIVMGEVLEHLDDPGKILRQLRSMLTGDGVAFVTTCANCPAKDHVYLFRNAGEIRQLIADSGFAIERELALRVDEREPPSPSDLINYAALIRRQPEDVRR